MTFQHSYNLVSSDIMHICMTTQHLPTQILSIKGIHWVHLQDDLDELVDLQHIGRPKIHKFTGKLD